MRMRSAEQGAGAMLGTAGQGGSGMDECTAGQVEHGWKEMAGKALIPLE